MKLANLEALFLHELKDLYDAEHTLVETLPKMVEAAHAPELKRALTKHLEETRGQVVRLEDVFSAFNEEPERQPCKGIKGIVAEGEKLMKEDASPGVADAGLIGIAQRAEHYEISAYGTLVVWARTIGNEAAVDLLEENLSEEKAANDKLTEIAESGVNQAARSSAGGEDQEEESEEEETEEPVTRNSTPRRNKATKRTRAPARARSRH